MTEEQADEIIDKLNHLTENTMSNAQGQQEILSLLKEISQELSKLRSEFGKQ